MDLLKGQLASRTGLDHRGKGLPSMAKLSEMGQIKEITFLTNTVVGRVHQQQYDSLSSGFRGTLIYWEIE